MELTHTHRHRVNFSMTSKGVISCDVTYEREGATIDEVVSEAGKLLTAAIEVCNKMNGENKGE